MAKGIKETPVLKGRDARRFFANMEADKNKKVSPEGMAKIRESYEGLRAIAKF